MSLVLVKVLDFALEPLGFGLLVILLGLLVSTKHRVAGQILVGTGALALWILATPWMGDVLVGSLEQRFAPRAPDEVPTADAIVVLGGGVGPATSPRLYPDLNDGGDRLWYGARLYRANAAPRVIVTGGAPPGRSAPTAPAMKILLVDWGVPADSILVESRSNTTYENARFTAKLARTRGLEQIILVTSAAHMRRAFATFRSTSLKIFPAPTDYRKIREPFTVMSLLPDADGLSKSTTAAHEYVGHLYYDLRGWID